VVPVPIVDEVPIKIFPAGRMLNLFAAPTPS
jgi:hypothetical protein